MKRSVTTTGSFFLIFGSVWFTMGALLSAFAFDVDVLSLLPIWFIAILALAILCARWRGKGILMLTPLALILLLIRLPAIIEGAKWVIFHVTSEYNKWLHIPVVFSGAEASQNEVASFLLIAGIVLVFLLGISICLRRSAILTIVFTIPIIFLTIVLKESRPNDEYVLGLIAIYLTMILSDSMRQDSFDDMRKGIFSAFSLAILILITTYFIAPPGSQSRSSFIDDIDNFLRNTIESMGLEMNKTGVGWPAGSSDEWEFNTELVEIAGAGLRQISDKSVLEITAAQPGTFYLRGFSMQGFNGQDWYRSPTLHPVFFERLSNAMPAIIADTYRALNPDSAQIGASMSIYKTGDTSSIVYQPYYYLSAPQVAGNPYTVNYYYPENSIIELFEIIEMDTLSLLADYNAFLRGPSVYKQIDDSTAEGLRSLAVAAGIDPSADRADIADKVATYVSSAARYTLYPYVIPEGEDFALYFLQTSKRGYCIHFATAATLMLRALDIPARFTSGFVITVSADDVNKAVVVADKDAHAWVEVYYDDIGWIPLEVTPAQPGFGSVAISTRPSSAGTPSFDDYEELYPEDYLDFDMDGVPQWMIDAAGQSDAQDQATSDPAARYVLIIMLCVTVIILRRAISQESRKRRFAQPDTNAAVLFAWRYASNLSGQPIMEIEGIALKARFSQHRITEEERKIVIEKTLDYQAKTYRWTSPPKRFWLKYIRGL